MAYKCFGKKTSGGRAKNAFFSNKELAEELHKNLLENLGKEK